MRPRGSPRGRSCSYPSAACCRSLRCCVGPHEVPSPNRLDGLKHVHATSRLDANPAVKRHRSWDDEPVAISAPRPGQGFTEAWIATVLLRIPVPGNSVGCLEYETNLVLSR